MHVEKILVSACLLGEKCRYDGGDNYIDKIEELKGLFDIIPFCPEVRGGLKTPRIPSERKGMQVINQQGKDVTKEFALGAERAYELCRYFSIKRVLLKEKSPSCGKTKIYDGEFNHTLIDGMGYTSEYLSKKGIQIYSEDEIDELIKARIGNKIVNR